MPGPERAIKELVGDGGNFLVDGITGSVTTLLFDKCLHYWAINTYDFGQCQKCGRDRNFKRIQKDTADTLYKKRAINMFFKHSQTTKKGAVKRT
jgi:hypothetical protein